MGVGWREWGYQIWLPSGAHRNPLPLILPLPTQFSLAPLTPTTGLSFSECWPSLTSSDPEEKIKIGSVMRIKLKSKDSEKCRPRLKNVKKGDTSNNSPHASSSGNAGRPPTSIQFYTTPGSCSSFLLCCHITFLIRLICKQYGPRYEGEA